MHLLQFTARRTSVQPREPNGDNERKAHGSHRAIWSWRRKVGRTLRLPIPFNAAIASRSIPNKECKPVAKTQQQQIKSRPGSASRRPSRVAFPHLNSPVEQDEEWFVAKIDGQWREYRLHDYARLFSVPGLYEHVVYDILGCRSPQVVRDLLERTLKASGVDPKELCVLDLGAGNGVVAQELTSIGVDSFIGVDLLPEAASAAERDRPGLYDEYVADDLTDLDPESARTLESAPINCLTCVAALGFGDVPPVAFAKAFSFVETGGWIAFTIKEDFLNSDDHSGFSRLIRHMIEHNIIEKHAEKKYVHRVNAEGEDLFYHAFVCKKLRDLNDTDLHGASLTSPSVAQRRASCSDP